MLIKNNYELFKCFENIFENADIELKYNLNNLSNIEIVFAIDSLQPIARNVNLAKKFLTSEFPAVRLSAVEKLAEMMIRFKSKNKMIVSKSLEEHFFNETNEIIQTLVSEITK